MIPASFGYDRPSSVDEALTLLERHGDEAKLLAGGQSLIPLLKLRLSSPGRVIDIGRLRELGGIAADGDGWRIGALTTYRELLEHDGLVGAYPLLGEAISGIGDVQVRNRGTVGGAIAHCDPASDLPALLLALDADVEVRGSGGGRTVPVAEFFQGAFTTSCGPNEMVASVRLPALPRGAGTAWSAVEQHASGYSLVGVAAVLGDVHGVLGQGTIEHVRVAITGVGEAPYRASAVEEALAGTSCSEADMAGAAEHATDGQTVASDIHADAAYRAALAQTLVRRALERAFARVS
jgi:carbon-monoxide dehydrogenase medium subunit